MIENSGAGARLYRRSAGAQTVPAESRQGTLSLSTSAVWPLLFGVYLVASISHAAATWDGSYQLFRSVNSGTPYVPHSRYIDVVLAWPALLISRLTGNIGLTQSTFGATYAIALLLPLALSWWIVRGRRPYLFVWAALGSSLVLLPGIINMSAEANLAALLTWPIALAALTGVDRRRGAAIVGVAGALILTHPSSIALLAFCAVVAGLSALRSRDRRGDFVRLAALLVGLTGLAALRFAVTRTSYETDQLSLSTITSHVQTSLQGAPAIMLLATLLIACVVLSSPVRKLARTAGPLQWYGDVWLVAALAGLIALAGTIWAWNLQAWGGAIDYRTFVAPASVVLMLFAAGDAFLYDRVRQLDGPQRMLRTAAAVGGAAAFAIVFLVQCLTWRAANLRLHDDLAAGSQTCVPVGAVPWVANTALGHWSVTPLSLLVQGRSPRYVVVSDRSCQAAQLAAGIPVSTFFRIRYQGDWFSLRTLAPAAAP